LTANSAIAGDGGGALRATLDNCTLTGNFAASGGATSLSAVNNCTLRGNSTLQSGGGSYSDRLTNCELTGNNSSGVHGGGGAYRSTLDTCALITNSAFSGGGALGSELSHCVLIGNSARSSGGGASVGTLNNCTLVGNSSFSAGGTYSCTNHNCIAYFNTAEYDPNYSASSILSFCCTTPQPSSGIGNITNEPAFVNLADGDFRLQPNSPCINAGNNSYVASTTDRDGNPSIVSGTVDIGAYEYQGAGSTISYAWLQQYGLPTDGSADLSDPDNDGLNNSQKWMADTDPTSAVSCLRLAILSNTLPVAVTFSSSAARVYTLLCCSNPTAAPAPPTVWTPVPGQASMPGNGAMLTLSDTNPPAPAFYRVSVRFP
jgi:hypothetical protein